MAAVLCDLNHLHLWLYTESNCWVSCAVEHIGLTRPALSVPYVHGVRRQRKRYGCSKWLSSDKLRLYINVFSQTATSVLLQTPVYACSVELGMWV